MISKKEFLQEVSEAVLNKKALVMDVVLELADKHNIDIETAGRIVASSSVLKSLMEQQSGQLRLLKAKRA